MNPQYSSSDLDPLEKVRESISNINERLEMILSRLPLPKPMSAEETAHYLGVTRGHIYDLVRTRRLAATRVGRRLLFSQSDIDEYMTHRRHRTSQELSASARKLLRSSKHYEHNG